MPCLIGHCTSKRENRDWKVEEDEMYVVLQVHVYYTFFDKVRPQHMETRKAKMAALAGKERPAELVKPINAKRIGLKAERVEEGRSLPLSPFW